MEGKKKEPIRKNPHFFKNEKFIVTQTPPNGESILSFRKRVNDAVGEIIKEQNKTDILIVSHLQTLRMIRFCITNSYDYDAWHSINYKHGEVVQEDYAQK